MMSILISTLAIGKRKFKDRMRIAKMDEKTDFSVLNFVHRIKNHLR